jgi:hypothetical protein
MGNKRIATRNAQGPVVSLLSNIETESKNRKTGDMAQQCIIRSDMHPCEAKQTGKDTAICGDCPLKKVCYVQVNKSIGSKYKSFIAGGYEETKEIPLLSKPLRLGEYGDPYFLDTETLDSLLEAAQAGNTGYTHQWEQPDSARLASSCMASVETLETKRKAQAMGFRTFRVLMDGDTLEPDEIICPYVGREDKVNCASCLLCDGKKSASDKRKSIAVPKH